MDLSRDPLSYNAWKVKRQNATYFSADPEEEEDFSNVEDLYGEPISQEEDAAHEIDLEEEVQHALEKLLINSAEFKQAMFTLCDEWYNSRRNKRIKLDATSMVSGVAK